MNSSVCDGCVVVACVNRNCGFDVCSSAKYNKSPEKIQMTEAQADKFINDLNLGKYKGQVEFEDLNMFILHRMKKEKYIVKSELQTLVEECEERWENYPQELIDDLHIQQNRIIQVLKKDHPEFKDK